MVHRGGGGKDIGWAEAGRSPALLLRLKLLDRSHFMALQRAACSLTGRIRLDDLSSTLCTCA
jgi:hypothetical protein